MQKFTTYCAGVPRKKQFLMQFLKRVKFAEDMRHKHPREFANVISSIKKNFISVLQKQITIRGEYEKLKTLLDKIGVDISNFSTFEACVIRGNKAAYYALKNFHDNYVVDFLTRTV